MKKTVKRAVDYRYKNKLAACITFAGLMLIVSTLSFEMTFQLQEIGVIFAMVGLICFPCFVFFTLASTKTFLDFKKYKKILAQMENESMEDRLKLIVSDKKVRKLFVYFTNEADEMEKYRLTLTKGDFRRDIKLFLIDVEENTFFH